MPSKCSGKLRMSVGCAENTSLILGDYRGTTGCKGSITDDLVPDTATYLAGAVGLFKGPPGQKEIRGPE